MSVRRVSSIALTVIALLMVGYTMASTHRLFQSYIPDINTHLGFSLVIVFLAGLIEARGRKRLLYLALIIVSLAVSLYIQLNWEALQNRVYFNTTFDLVVGCLLIIACFAATIRSFGLPIPIITTIIVIYGFVGQYLTGPLRTHPLSFEHAISKLAIGLDGGGVLGNLTSISLHYIFLFMIFGGLLQATGAVSFIMNLATAITHRIRGAPALLAVVSSAMIGSLTGSVMANIAITGSFSIPLMKKTGYKPYQAGAIEAAASTGGQIMPPIMGIGAFVMAGVTEIPYVKICLMAIIPALIYYFVLGTYVYLRAGQLDLKKASEPAKIDVKELLSSAPSFVIPFIVLIVLLVMKYSVMYAAFWTIITLLVMTFLRKKKRPSLSQYVDGIVKGSLGGAAVCTSLGLAAMMASIFTSSGVGIRISFGIEAWSGGNLLSALLIIWTVCILLGMGGIGFVAYLIISIFAAPALMKMGLAFGQAHFFIFFATAFMGVTPPMAPSAVLASKLAGSRYLPTAWETGRLAAAGLLLPLVFAYAPIALLQPVNPFLEILILVGFIIAIFSLQIGAIGYYFLECSLKERLILLAGVCSLLVFVPVHNYAFFITGISLFIIVTLWQLRKRRVLAK